MHAVDMIQTTMQPTIDKMSEPTKCSMSLAGYKWVFGSIGSYPRLSALPGYCYKRIKMARVLIVIYFSWGFSHWKYH